MVSKAFLIYIERYLAIPLVGFLIAHGVLGMENKDVIVQIIDQIISGVIMLALYYLSHKTKLDTTTSTQVSIFNGAKIKSLISSLFARAYTTKTTEGTITEASPTETTPPTTQ